VSLALGWKLIGKMTGDDLRSYRLLLEKKGLSLQTVRHILSDVRCLLHWSEDSGLVAHSPFPRRIMPRLQERPPDRLTEEEVRLLVALPDPHGFVLRLALATGLWWAELCRSQASYVENGVLVVSQTKSGRMWRVPLPQGILDEVRSRCGRLAAFSSRNSASFKATVRRLSGVARFHVHQTRHTFACRWLEAGGSLPALQQVLGHSTGVTTQRYARLGEDVVRREALKVGETVANAVAGRS
jgi:integrase/recombinase XerD